MELYLLSYYTLISIIEKLDADAFLMMPSSPTRRVMPYEHDRGPYFIVSNFCGTVIHRQS